MTRMIALPADIGEVEHLRVGDTFYLTGMVFTARDTAHQLLLERHEQGEKLPVDPSGMALYHCGPLVKRENSAWRVLSAGPTTSMRMEAAESRFLAVFHPRIIIGKGGMGQSTQTALMREKAVYAHFTGGAGALAAKSIDRVDNVLFLDKLGMAEAVWVLHVTRFGPLLVTMDSQGGNLYRDLKKSISANKRRIAHMIEKERKWPSD